MTDPPRGGPALICLDVRALKFVKKRRGIFDGFPPKKGSGCPMRTDRFPDGTKVYFRASSAVRMSELPGRTLKSSSTFAQATFPVLSIT